MKEIHTIPNQARYWMRRAEIHRATQEWDQAALSYTHVIESDNHNSQAWLGLGQVLMQLGHWEEAETAFYSVLNDDVVNCDAYWALSQIFKRQDRMKEWQFCLGWLLALNPDHPEARYDLACALEDLGDHWNAKRHWLKLIKAAPESIYANYARQRLKAI
jgi:tetratricopeptide (TPR) repeat protein